MTDVQTVGQAVGVAPVGASTRVRVLLIDDQRMVGEAVRRMLASEEGLDYEFCMDPLKALETAQRFGPTVILQDLVMPGIDGLSLVEQFRAQEATRDIPMIVLSSQEEPLIKADAFARGANDYLVKLPDRVELVARIRYHSRGYILLQERNAAFSALAENQRILAAELAEAADYVRSRLPATLSTPVRVRWDMESCSSVGGDAFGYHWIDDDHFAVYLLDVCGHGVGAALLSVSVLNTLSSRSLHNADPRLPEQVLTSLNELFQMESHNNMYFTLWYGVYHRQTRQLRYATAGHPPALLFGASEQTPQRLAAPALPIGCMPGMDYPSSEVQISPNSRLYVFSDGVYEVQLLEGREMALEDLIPIVAAAPVADADIRGIRDTVAALQGRARFDDDFSLVELTFM